VGGIKVKKNTEINTMPGRKGESRLSSAERKTLKQEKHRREREYGGGGGPAKTIFLVWAIIMTAGFVIALFWPTITGSATRPCSGTVRVCIADDWSYDGDPTSHPSAAIYYAVTGNQDVWDLIHDNNLDSTALWDTYMILHPSVANETTGFSINYGVITSNDAMFDYETNTTNLIGSCTDIPAVSVFAMAWMEIEIDDVNGNEINYITVNLYDTAALADPVATIANADELWCITCSNSLVTITLGAITTTGVDTYTIAAIINGVAVTLAGES
jgi:hypothetical protein